LNNNNRTAKKPTNKPNNEAAFVYVYVFLCTRSFRIEGCELLFRRGGEIRQSCFDCEINIGFCCRHYKEGDDDFSFSNDGTWWPENMRKGGGLKFSTSPI